MNPIILMDPYLHEAPFRNLEQHIENAKTRYRQNPTQTKLWLGDSPLHLAADRGNATLCQLLLEYGANVSWNLGEFRPS